MLLTSFYVSDVCEYLFVGMFPSTLKLCNRLYIWMLFDLSVRWVWFPLTSSPSPLVLLAKVDP